MKKIGLLFLVAFLSVGLAGCPGSKDADPVGTWEMTYDTNCDGSTGKLVLHIHQNNTYIDSRGFNGTWSVDSKTITLNDARGGLIYGGVVDGDRMINGTWVGGNSGCWTAQRTSSLP
jgi:hypothetical protein